MFTFKNYLKLLSIIAALGVANINVKFIMHLLLQNDRRQKALDLMNSNYLRLLTHERELEEVLAYALDHADQNVREVVYQKSKDFHAYTVILQDQLAADPKFATEIYKVLLDESQK